MRRSIAAVLTVASLVVSPACGLMSNGYSVRGGKVYYTWGLPARTTEVAGADAASFQDLGGVFARDRSKVYVSGEELAGADASSFEVLERGFAKDRSHVWLGSQPISNDPAHFELLPGELAKDSTAVYCHDGRVLSNDAAHFVRVSATDNILGYTKDSQTAYYYCSAIPGADPSSFRVLNENMHCAADQQNAYHGSTVIQNADPSHFPPGQPVTDCSDTSITFGR
jgi:DKNYY family